MDQTLRARAVQFLAYRRLAQHVVGKRWEPSFWSIMLNECSYPCHRSSATDSSPVTPASHEISLVTILGARTMHRPVASTYHSGRDVELC
jgi:hypothetical protein